MHGEVDTPGEQRLLDLLGEQALAADFGQATVLHPVARCANGDDLDGTCCGEVGMGREQPLAHECRLAQCHRAAAGADAERVRRHAGRSNPLRAGVPTSTSISRPHCYIIPHMPDPAVRARPPAAEAGYLAGLNDAQRRAVEAVDGPVLVLAGAGTGKTRVLTTRLAYILGTGRAFPAELLAVTFTNKAAREMRERLEAMIGRAAEGVWLGTFHAIASRILRRHAELVGLKSSFTILDTDDQLRLLKQILAAENIDERRWPARLLLAQIQRWKDRGLGPEKVPATDADGFAHGRAIDLYRQYQERLITVNAVDFGDLLLHNLALLTGNPDVLADYQRRFRYLLVDEYQDTNVAQYLWLRLLAQQRRNLCCVGDDDQSIYSWRGAEIGNILRFERDFPGARSPGSKR